MSDTTEYSGRVRPSARGHMAASDRRTSRPSASGARVARPSASQHARARGGASGTSERPRTRASQRVASRETSGRSRTRGRATSENTSKKTSAAQGIRGWVGSHMLVCIVAGVIVLALAMLYSPAKALYGARRTNAILSERLDAATSSAQTLQSEVDSLMTREGIEDEARRRGYVEEGDTAVDMDGVTDSGSATTDESVTNADSSSSSDEEQTPWYTSVLDFIFGYDPSTQGVG